MYVRVGVPNLFGFVECGCGGCDSGWGGIVRAGGLGAGVWRDLERRIWSVLSIVLGRDDEAQETHGAAPEGCGYGEGVDAQAITEGNEAGEGGEAVDGCGRAWEAVQVAIDCRYLSTHGRSGCGLALR